jgi:hypothetical protein
MEEHNSLEPIANPDLGEEQLLTPELFGSRLRQEPPARLELPDRVELGGASLAAFLESGHFPYGRYRIGEARFFVTPSPELTPPLLETIVRTRSGQQVVGAELLVWRPTSFRVAAGTASEARDARPFVAPSGARAYLWLGRVLPGGPLVLRDANNTEERVPVPEALLSNEDAPSTPAVVRDPHSSPTESADSIDRHAAGTDSTEGGADPTPARRVFAGPLSRFLGPGAIRAPERPRPEALRRAEEAFERGDDRHVVEGSLREVMVSTQASGEALAGAGRLWQAIGRLEAASAAFTMALERGSVEGALGLSRLAVEGSEGLAAAARALEAAIARNLRSPGLHTRYAELLDRVGLEPQAEWHRRQAEELLHAS